jgi:hypothetical protein
MAAPPPVSRRPGPPALEFLTSIHTVTTTNYSCRCATNTERCLIYR